MSDATWTLYVHVHVHATLAYGCLICTLSVITSFHSSSYQDLERVVKVLLHKTVESNTFIREDVEKMMHEIVQYATPAKGLLAIIAGGQG